MTETADALAFYATPGVMTDLSSLSGDLEGAPADPRSVASMVQGLLIHPHWAIGYGVEVPDERQAELGVRSAVGILQGALARDPRPLTEPREPADRFLGNCRDFTTLTIALLRAVGHPARARCGFAGYFEAGRWLDHWVVQHWNGDRWVTLDAQVDDFQREVAEMTDDPTDLPPGQFLPAGEAWLACQSGLHDPETFGLLDMWGAWFIAGNTGRDFAALNKVEMLPWDDWGVLALEEGATTDEPVVTDIAEMLTRDDTAEIRARYAAEPTMQAGPHISSLGADGTWGPQTVAELLPNP